MSSASSQMFKRLFTSSPAKMLVLLPTSFEIVAVTEQYLSATRTREEDLLGKTLFEVFPDDPREQNPDAVRSLSRSLHRVQSLKSLDVMGVQRYPIPVPGGGFEERFWSPVNSPVLDEAGELEFIIHRVEDVTSLVRESLGTEPSNLEAQAALQDVVVRSQELRLALSKLQERQDILESISDAFFALDHQWRFTYVNRQASVLLERSRNELIGQSIWNEFPEALGTEFERQYRQAAAGGNTARFQAFYGALGKWFDVSAYPVPEGLAVYFRDLTSERAYQERLRLADAALARQNDVVIITEADPLEAPEGPKIVYVNEAFERMTGYTRAEAIGQTPRLLQGPGTDRQELDAVRAALHAKVPFRCELKNYKRSGEEFWLELSLTPLFDQDGRCTHFVAVERDVTERKLQEAALQRAQERSQLISRATNAVIWDWDLVTNEVWWNEAKEEVFGDHTSPVLVSPDAWSSRIHPDDHQRVLDSINSVLEGSETNWSCEYRFLKLSEDVSYVMDRGFVIRDEDGTALRMVGSMLDITERKELEQRLRESQKLEAVGQLTGGVAHDFNNLLTVILGNTEMMLELLSDEDLRSMADMTLSATRRAAQLTSRLLAFARRRALDPKVTDLGQLVEAMYPLIRRTLPETIALKVISDPEPAIAELDAGELDTALLNLVVNARDAMPEGGTLTIETGHVVLDAGYADGHLDVSPGEYVLVCVSDTGVGMDRDTAGRVFEPFFTTKEVGKGSGLGLSMVFGFTKQSGGHIKVYSEPGEGTAVKLYFPRVRTADSHSFDLPVEALAEGGTEHILIAEDDELVIEHLKRQLVSLGYRVTTSTSGPEALEALAVGDRVDLLLTDIIMPGGMNGRELARRSKELYPNLKVLYTSGYTEHAIGQHGRLEANTMLLSKPYTRSELASKVRYVLDGD